ncbi:uncharacterized protein PAC_08474 [Phialocephala subalpina]|uniref:Uncharacterized protein n=1 Tax=Phialocephala subalpina TaxID=576137 RepID=A0A1L7X0N2_9HELO|nr:uncharacterized protein PAC_08474 [Phialocephala subalpina]
MAGKKRKSPPDSSDEIYSNKSRSRPSAEARVDPTYGQRSAIPGLDDGNMYGDEDDSLMYDEDMDALSYLRSVRQEAFGIPNLLVAPKDEQEDERDIYEDGVGDFRGRYEDGAYLAAAGSTPEDAQDTEEEEKDSQVVYFDSIISRYEDLRSRLAQIPPVDVVRNLDSNHPTQVGPLNKVLTRWWIKNMQQSDPQPAQVACMSKSSVLRLLRLLTQGSLLKRESQVQFGVSYWVWSLLAKLPDRGLLNSEEIGVVRELGKKAVLIGMGLNEVKEWKEGIEDVEAQFEENLGGDEETARNDDEIELEDDISAEGYPTANIEHAADDSQSTDTPSQTLPVDLDPLDMDRDAEQPVSASSQTLVADGEAVGTAENNEDLSGGGIVSNSGDGDDAEALAAMKARMLGRLTSPEASVNLEPETSAALKSRPPPSKLNTRATVDMIITVAGEKYGQRDLLEFRSQWAHIV